MPNATSKAIRGIELPSVKCGDGADGARWKRELRVFSAFEELLRSARAARLDHRPVLRAGLAALLRLLLYFLRFAWNVVVGFFCHGVSRV
jgi:hypothetical protein